MRNIDSELNLCAFSQKASRTCRNRTLHVIFILVFLALFAVLFEALLSRFRKRGEMKKVISFIKPDIMHKFEQKSTLFGHGEPRFLNKIYEKKLAESTRLLSQFANFSEVGDLNIPLNGASMASKLLADGTLEYQIQHKNSPSINFLISCNQSDYAHLYHALEITVHGSIIGAFSVGLRDWINPCMSDWASRPLTAMVSGDRYGVRTENHTIYYIPLYSFRKRLVPRIRGFSLLGFKIRPGTIRFKRVRLTADPPPAGWVDPGSEDLAQVEYFCHRPGLLALCIDDGSDQSMRYVLDQLASAEATATFFQVGRHVGKSLARLSFARRALRAGHAIEHHSWRHEDTSELPLEAVREEIDRTRAQHRRLFHRVIRYFRPPHGHFDAILLRELALRNMTAVMWSFSLSDYGSATRATIWEAFLRAMARFSPDRDGIIGVQHFSLNASVDLLPRMTQTARQLGWRIVSLEECLRDSDPDELAAPARDGGGVAPATPALPAG